MSPSFFHGVLNAWVPMSLRHRTGWLYFVLGLILTITSASATAQNPGDFIPKGEVSPQRIVWVNSTQMGVDTRVWATSTFPGMPKNHNLPVHVSNSTLGRLARGAMKWGGRASGWYAAYQAVKGLMDGVQWVIDEETKLPREKGIPSEQVPPFGMYYQTPVLADGVYRTATTADKAAEFVRLFYASAYPGSQPVILWRTVDGTYHNFDIHLTDQYGTFRSFGLWVQEKYNGPNMFRTTALAGRSITDDELVQLLKQHPEVINAILIDPETGKPIRTQELVDALNNLAAQLAAKSGNPAADPLQPDTDMNLDNETDGKTDSDWPDFCDWATPVCDFMKWVKKEPEESEKPEVEWDESPPDTQSWNSGLGGGSCPSAVSVPISIGGGGGNVTFEWQPLCTFAEMMKPFIVALAGIVAAFIVAGVRSGKSA